MPDTIEKPTETLTKTPPVKQELADISLERLMIEVKNNPNDFLSRIKPLDYAGSIESQKDALALTKTHILLLISSVTRDISDADLAKLDAETLSGLITSARASFPQTDKSHLDAYDALMKSKNTSIGKDLLDDLPAMKTIIQTSRTAARATAPSPSGTATPPLTSTLPV